MKLLNRRKADLAIREICESLDDMEAKGSLTPSNFNTFHVDIDDDFLQCISYAHYLCILARRTLQTP